MKQVVTIQFTDDDSGGNAVVIIRAARGSVALCLSREEDGDVEVVFNPEVCRNLIEALEQAISLATGSEESG
jgi:hypothetical protein